MKKAVTLMGMSGVGKSYFSLKLAEWGWGYYSCDVEIGKDLLGVDRALRADDIRELMEYLGLLGDPARGGIEMGEFMRRQKFYKIAEMASLLTLTRRIRESEAEYFVNDSTGSLCEITDPDVIDFVGDQTLIVYIEASEDEEEQLLQRAREYPKPLYYPPADFQGWVDQYLQENDLRGTDEMDPQDFARWVFPVLLAARKPKYEAIALRHGVTIASKDLQGVESEAAFVELIGEMVVQRG